MKTAIALASLALQRDKKLFRVILTLSGADVHAQSVGIDP